jgi:hypothetical protein
VGEIDYVRRKDRREVNRLRRAASFQAAGIRAGVALDKLRVQGIAEVTSYAIECLGDIDQTRRLETVRAGNRLFDELSVQIEVKAARQIGRLIDDLYDPFLTP